MSELKKEARRLFDALHRDSALDAMTLSAQFIAQSHKWIRVAQEARRIADGKRGRDLVEKAESSGAAS